MLSKALALLAFGASSLAITINGPSPNAYWVQNISNTITWSFSSNDPNPIDITVTNSNDTILNGAFSIQRGVDLTNGSFTVTNVTLKVGSGYVVNFVNSTNGTQVYASSQSFDVKTPGTPKSSDSAAQPSATSPSSSGSASSSAAASSAAGAANSNAPSGGLAQFDALAAVPVLAVTGIMTIAGVLTAF